MKLLRLKSILLALLVVLTPELLDAQNFRGAISGRLTDSAGAVISGIDIAATEQSTHVEHLTKTSAAGEFNFTDLPPGGYTVTVAAPGFRTIKAEIST